MTGTAAPWMIDRATYPETTPREQLRFLLSYAILAPSTHNTQPWQFTVLDDRIELWADTSRLLPRIDPERRQLHMSCGAALMNLRIAMRCHGNLDEVAYLPDEARPDLLAVLKRGDDAEPSARDLELFDAIPRRRTNRDPFRDTPIGQNLADEIMGEAASEQAWMVRLHPFQKLDVADAIAKADHRQYADQSYRDELAEWLVPRGSMRHDGVPMAKRDVATTLPLLAPLAVRLLDRGDTVAAHEAALTVQAPMIAVLGTELDDPLAWLWAGEALEAVFLHATGDGVAMSFLNQVVEDPELRRAVATATNHDGFPQLVLRFGYGPEQTPTPRRSIREMMR